MESQIIENLLVFLKQDNNYFHMADKLNKENIVFVNLIDVRTDTGKILKLKKLALKMGNNSFKYVWVDIDKEDYKIYLKI